MSSLQVNARIQNFRTSLSSPLEKSIGKDGVKAVKIIAIAAGAIALLSCLSKFSSARLALGGVSIATGLILKSEVLARDDRALPGVLGGEGIGLIEGSDGNALAWDQSLPNGLVIVQGRNRRSRFARPTVDLPKIVENRNRPFSFLGCNGCSDC